MRLLTAALATAACAIAACAQQIGAVRASEMDRAIEEFKLQTRNLGLRADGPTKPTKNGSTRRWHGRLYENFRNDFLDAVPHEIRQRGGTKSLLRRNQFGFNVTGPLAIPKLWRGHNTFLSASYEGVRERISRTALTTIPTVAERTGDYSPVVDPAGDLLLIYDPQTTRPNPQFDASQPVSRDNLQYLRDPFPDNRIPAARLDAAARKAITLYPEPNAAAGPFFRNNYFVNAPETSAANGMIVKLDHTLRERHRIALETAFSNGLLGAAHWFPNIANPGPTDRKYASRRMSLEHAYTATSKTVNTFTFGASTDSLNSGADDEAFPVYSFQPYLSMGRSYPVSRNARNTYAWTDALSSRRGPHSLRLITQYVRYQVNTFWPQYPAGSFRFTPGITSLPGIVNTGHAFASFLLGLPEYAESTQVVSPSYFRRNSGLVALRDQYQLAKNFQINVGLNLDISTPRTEKYNRQSTIDLEATNPSNGRPGALVAATDGRPAFQPTRARLEPSASIAWNPLDNSRSVLRASFARSYAAIPIYSGQWGIQGFSAHSTFLSPNPQLEPALVLTGGLPPSSRPLPDLRPEAANDTIADLIDTTDRQPVYQSASISFERELPASMVVSVGAVYSGGKNLLLSNSGANPNAIPLDALAYRDRLNDEAFNRSLRPYPQFKGFDVYSSYPLGRYQRDAGYVRLEKRASMGLSFSASYEFSKQMDDYSGPSGKQDYFQRQNEWSLTASNEPHVLQVSYVYELPFGSSKSIFSFPDWRRYLSDGWSLSGMAVVRSGNPLALHPQFNNTGGVLQALHVNVVPGVDPHVPDPDPNLWFNPAAFDQPADFTIGDASRTHPSLRNPGNQNYDLSLTKRVALGADRTLEFSAAGFNFINHADWNDPDTVIGPASARNVNAGRIIGSHGGRVVQFGLRLSF